jgi:serine/threonine-protein kinase HipA
MLAKPLQVWLDGRHIADIEKRAWNDLRCRYTDEALGRWPQNSPVVSCSLPLGQRPGRAVPYLKGLLPEGHALQSLAALAGHSVLDTFELLERFGRDIAGALVIGQEPPQADRWGIEEYSDETLTNEIESLDDHPLGVYDDSELSLAGLQNKLVLVRQPDETWGRPLHGRPSTHILKVEDRRWPGLVSAEAACLTLAHQLGLTTIRPELHTFGTIPCLIVERFDRRASGSHVQRIHQEDLCQAIGCDPSLKAGRAKYERGGGGGPRLRDAAELLDRYALEPSAQLERLAAVATFTVAIGNADAHGKNLAFLHDTPESIALAPLYDTVPTILWRTLTRDFSMSLNGRFSVDDIAREDIVAEAVSWAMSRRVAESVTLGMLEAIRAALADGVIETEELARDVGKRVENLLADRPASARSVQATKSSTRPRTA